MRAAATAVTPLPLRHRRGGRAPGGEPLVVRIAEIVAGGGASVTLAKAGTVAVLAGSAISGPAVVDRVSDRPPHGPSAATSAVAATHEPERARARAAAAQPEPVHAVTVASRRASHPARPADTQRRSRGPGRRREGRSGGHRDRGHGRDEAESRDEPDGDHSGRHNSGGGGDSGRRRVSGSGGSGSGSSGGGDGSGGTGGHDGPSAPAPDQGAATPAAGRMSDAAALPLPPITSTPEPAEIDESRRGEADSSGSGSGSADHSGPGS